MSAPSVKDIEKEGGEKKISSGEIGDIYVRDTRGNSLNWVERLIAMSGKWNSFTTKRTKKKNLTDSAHLLDMVRQHILIPNDIQLIKEKEKNLVTISEKMSSVSPPTVNKK